MRSRIRSLGVHDPSSERACESNPGKKHLKSLGWTEGGEVTGRGRDQIDVRTQADDLQTGIANHRPNPGHGFGLGLVAQNEVVAVARHSRNLDVSVAGLCNPGQRRLEWETCVRERAAGDRAHLAYNVQGSRPFTNWRRDLRKLLPLSRLWTKMSAPAATGVGGPMTHRVRPR
jgi:hypothetical protein